MTESSTTKLSDGRTTAARAKNDLEKLPEEGINNGGGSGREGSGVGTAAKRKKNRGNKQEDKVEEIINDNFCKPGWHFFFFCVQLIEFADITEVIEIERVYSN